MQGLVTKRTNQLKLPYLKDIFCNNDMLSDLSDINVAGFEHVALHRAEKKRTLKRDSRGGGGGG